MNLYIIIALHCLYNKEKEEKKLMWGTLWQQMALDGAS